MTMRKTFKANPPTPKVVIPVPPRDDKRTFDARPKPSDDRRREDPRYQPAVQREPVLDDPQAETSRDASED
ncbi:MAG: hypothetical protein Q8R82_18850 [Hyphomonadaceae bacterium]|nr:hypothetical protein [Hyphomonadaceae bacterium]